MMRYLAMSAFAMLAMAPAWAEGSIGYALQSGAGDYTNHALTARLSSGAYWGGLSVSSGMEGTTQVDQSATVNGGFTPHPSVELSGNIGQNLDTALRTVDYALDATWTTPWHVVADQAVRLGGSWGYADYALRNGVAAASGQLPDQYHWGLTASIPVTQRAAVSLQSRWNWYTVDPLTMAVQLLQRRHPKINAAMGLADFASLEHRASVNWRSALDWRWELGASYGQTVVGQSQRTAEASLEVPWGNAVTVGFSFQHAQSNEVRRPNGQLLMPFQASNSVSVSWSRSWN